VVVFNAAFSYFASALSYCSVSYFSFVKYFFFFEKKEKLKFQGYYVKGKNK